MQTKVGDMGDISLLFFLVGANFWAILGHSWAIFWCKFFLAKNVSLLFVLLFASLVRERCHQLTPDQVIDHIEINCILLRPGYTGSSGSGGFYGEQA